MPDAVGGARRGFGAAPTSQRRARAGGAPDRGGRCRSGAERSLLPARAGFGTAYAVGPAGSSAARRGGTRRSAAAGAQVAGISSISTGFLVDPWIGSDLLSGPFPPSARGQRLPDRMGPGGGQA